MTPVAANCDRRSRQGTAASTRFALPLPEDLTLMRTSLFDYCHGTPRIVVWAGVIYPSVSMVREKLSWQPWSSTRRPASLP